MCVGLRKRPSMRSDNGFSLFCRYCCSFGWTAVAEKFGAAIAVGDRAGVLGGAANRQNLAR
jgi:hypothetical protein